MPGAFDPATFIVMLEGRGHGGFVGLQHVAHGPDWVELAFDPRPDLAADECGQLLASGPIVTLMDVATSLAIWTRLGRFAVQATLDLRLDYLRAAAPGRRVHGRGECYRLTRRVAFVRGLAHDGDAADPVAHVAGTFMLLEEG